MRVAQDLLDGDERLVEDLDVSEVELRPQVGFEEISHQPLVQDMGERGLHALFRAVAVPTDQPLDGPLEGDVFMGDLFEIVPRLTQEIKKARAGA